MTTNIYPIIMVNVNRYCELSVESIAAVTNRIARGEWMRTIHYDVVKNRRRINLEQVDLWDISGEKINAED